MRNSIKFLLILFVFSGFTSTWGFYGHRLINRTAVYCLPGDMINLFKSNIDYLSEHAVDPDKRRYATPFEAVRHYIDIDHWGDRPFESVPRNYVDAVTKFGAFLLVNDRDTTIITFSDSEHSKEFQNARKFIKNNWMSQRYEDEQTYVCDSLMKYFDLKATTCSQFRFVDVFSTYGILPYELGVQQYRLTEAFQTRDVNRILRIAADMGHYIADAHVPLHTTENYNGQMSGQEGIHAFWESRLPELFAEEQYDFIVGQADYIDDKESFFWGIVEDSHGYLNKVLEVELELRSEYDEDKQYCYEKRLGSTVRLECEGYAEAYHRRLDGMVENRMRSSIKAVADCWYTAWVDAGQPDFDRVGIISEIDDRLDKAFGLKRIFGRKH
ncbi:zinc dependent phospholipase C family protein [Portibacter marinus]|uniref:zinc dependent phospholipase C family protein n=1 Tax=Portibacter marinus TaxID=2898660 RepID=UPI001F2A0AE5|nr:zinc dependent phospholipase C family protein [Portibacter marinus]